MSLTLEEFLRFADSVSEVLPGFESFAERARRHPVVVERFLPAIEARLKERAEQYRKMGLVVPGQLGGASPETLEAPGAASPDYEEILGALLGVISEKTGYETEELDVDYELEADLGIDTVKQAEIFGEVRERYGLAPDAEFRLADYPTIAKLAGWLFEQVEPSGGAGGSDSVDQQVESITGEDSPDGEDSVESPLGDASTSTEQETKPPVIEPRPDAALAAEVREVETPSDFTLPPDFRIRRPVWVDCPLPQGESYREQRIEGRVGILGTGPLVDRLREELAARGATVVEEAENLHVVVDLGAGVMDAFDLARKLDGNPPVQWVSAQLRPTGLLDEVLVDAGRSGARAGFAKAVAREWTARSEVEQGQQPCRAKVIDLAADLPADRAAAMLCDEIAAPDGAWEIQRDEDRRRVLELRVENFPVPDQPLEGQPVFVLTGGTRGITALVARDLARRGPCRLALFARTAPAVEPLDEKAAKAEIRAGLEAEGVRATPVRIQQKLRRLLSADEARQNVEAMRNLGAEVHFFQVDLSDPGGVAEALDAVGELLGDVHAVIHGAGIEESRPLGSKDHEAFQRVFGGKAGGGLALVRHLGPGTKFVSMGSVAGRFGNAGQVDYSAANDAMARVCIVRPNSLHVDWTAWADVGMAVRGGMEKLLTDRGVQMLPSDQGSALLVDMMLSGISGEVMVAGRLGGFATAPSHPLLDSVDWEGDAVVVTHEFTGDSDSWLDDHAIDGTRVLPGVIGLEMMVAAARLVHPDKGYAGAREVSYQ
ncbi:MAG: SDR family NAD(P)-dependent oxidoreductase, partial [Myxococcota bacterium]|nr:SDR family NAD(P)-dependent oxidoreductase [Myxococcota bacterium]